MDSHAITVFHSAFIFAVCMFRGRKTLRAMLYLPPSGPTGLLLELSAAEETELHSMDTVYQDPKGRKVSLLILDI